VKNNPLNYGDPFGLYDYSGGAGFKEKAADCWACGAGKARKAKNLADKAGREAQEKFPGGGLHNGPGDAWSHCYWSCLMARNLGQKCAKAIGDNHEAAGDRTGQRSEEHKMDQSNNSTGRNLASQSGDCGDLCKKALDDGKLIVIYP
jgi:hypothetical protein